MNNYKINPLVILLSLLILLFGLNGHAYSNGTDDQKIEYSRNAGDYVGQCYVADMVAEKYCLNHNRRKLDECVSDAVKYLPETTFKNQLAISLKKFTIQQSSQISKTLEQNYENGLKASSGSVESLCNAFATRINSSLIEAQSKLALSARLMGEVRNDKENLGTRIILIDKKISIELPNDWTLLRGEVKEKIESNVLSSTENQAAGDLKFAANIYDGNGKTLALTNIRMYPDNKFSQDDLKNLSPEMLRGLDVELRGLIEKMSAAVNHKSIQISPTQLVNINGLNALREDRIYERNVDKERLREIKYRIWNAPKSFTFSFSFKISEESRFLPILENMINSLRVEK